MNEELHEIVTEVQKKEDQEGKEQDKIIEKLTQLKIEDKRVYKNIKKQYICYYRSKV